APSPEADRATLLRRLSFDLTGLPPGPANGHQSTARGPGKPPSTAHGSPFPAQERLGLADRLLASPALRSGWGRHWLDVARYAESSGREINATYPQAWRYRDYVIDSFNADKPFDRFLVEQIAGDLLPATTDEQISEQHVATGFLALGTKN